MFARRVLGRCAIVGIALVVSATQAQAATVSLSSPQFDRWMYPFNATPGTRTIAPTFGMTMQDYTDNGIFDFRDGQFLVGFNTTGLLPTPGPGQTLKINSVTVTATHGGTTFTYDPTYDSYKSYLDSSHLDFITDSDAGRPIELNGVGLRGTYTDLTFGAGSSTQFAENSPFGAFSPPPTSIGTRYAYAASFDNANALVDISNNVPEEFEYTPFAIGTTAASAGSLVGAGTTFSFDVDLNNTFIRDYILNGLSNNGLFFTLSSLLPTSQVDGAYPAFYTRENFGPGALPPTLLIDFDIIDVQEPQAGNSGVPEPASASLAALAAIALVMRQNRK